MNKDNEILNTSTKLEMQIQAMNPVLQLIHAEKCEGLWHANELSHHS